MNERELSEYFSHYQRPIVVPKAKILPPPAFESIGYAEVINAGKSRYNEDQASIVLSKLRPKSSDISINYLYIGLFDGHGGPGCAVKASKELHQIVHESLEDALEKIMFAFKKEQEGNITFKHALLRNKRFLPSFKIFYIFGIRKPTLFLFVFHFVVLFFQGIPWHSLGKK